jgi:hypothetical protein
MRQQPPLERIIVVPDWMRRIDQKTFVVVQHISGHHCDRRKHQMLYPKWPTDCAGITPVVFDMVPLLCRKERRMSRWWRQNRPFGRRRRRQLALRVRQEANLRLFYAYNPREKRASFRRALYTRKRTLSQPREYLPATGPAHSTKKNHGDPFGRVPVAAALLKDARHGEG